MSSINTNSSAMTALQSLAATNKALSTTQSRISTGCRVGIGLQLRLQRGDFGLDLRLVVGGRADGRDDLRLDLVDRLDGLVHAGVGGVDLGRAETEATPAAERLNADTTLALSAVPATVAEVESTER